MGRVRTSTTWHFRCWGKAMMRRVGAMIGIVVLLGLVFALVWRVYEHRKSSDEYDEPALVSLRVSQAPSS